MMVWEGALTAGSFYPPSILTSADNNLCKDQEYSLVSRFRLRHLVPMHLSAGAT